MESLVIPITDPSARNAERFGPKGANLATLTQAGLPTPGGFCVDAAAYRYQIHALGLEASARGAFATDSSPQARRYALDMKLGLMDKPIAPEIESQLLAAWRHLAETSGTPIVVRSSALVEDRYGSSFAGQFESFLDLDNETDFLIAVRSCWAALWMTRALRYMATHEIDPAETAMGLIIQPLVKARAAGGALSQTAGGDMLINATPGLGAAIAQGEVTPDRYVLDRNAVLKETVAAPTQYHALSCAHRPALAPRNRNKVADPCLTPAQAVELGQMVRRIEELMGMAVEIEWAMDEAGFRMLQSRPLHLEPEHEYVADDVWLRQPHLRGQPAGAGWTSGLACVINCECELSRVAPGAILVTKMAGPALSQILQRVAGVVAELGGSTSHLASLARERGIPMVLGAHQATQRIPEGSMVSVDGVSGMVRWMPAELNSLTTMRMT
ncbi:MAG: PEP/pyruvate-binding domain-containing protein [Burkholderiales bacterium]|nr:PEP/pyruvate-binding domain-containing protein [Burkholderiales bacterium]